MSGDWHDYVPFAVLIVAAPLAWCVLKKLWRSVPERAPRNEWPRRKPKRPSRTEHDLMQVATFMSDVQADQAKAALEGDGIPCYIRRDDCGGWRPWLRFATGGLRLVVRREDAERAAEVLRGMFGD